ncbi:hypothetical protein NDU88_006566 [Pleurodeles waltl]|uniref:Uncharacterized protein n=1 Tax=Pleurodeles waltl TaxID=8319 RepID=A0AAV7X1W7_PLEWA|nr:hypothetical protein NDU88_006566 [Pleurodeles waltl]
MSERAVTLTDAGAGWLTSLLPVTEVCRYGAAALCGVLAGWAAPAASFCCTLPEAAPGSHAGCCGSCRCSSLWCSAGRGGQLLLPILAVSGLA